MSDQANTADVLVIGMGPVGLHQIFQLGLLGLRVAAVDSLPEPGGQCRALYADKLIHDIPGLPMVSAQQLSDNLFQQIQPLYPDLHFGQVAQALRPWQEDGVRRGFELTTQTGLCLHARAVVLAAGAGAYQRRPLDLPGAEQWRGTQIFEEPMPAERFAGQHVAVMGGGNEAIDQCLALVAAGAVARKWLAEHYGIRIRGYLSQLGEIAVPFRRWEDVGQNPFFVADQDKVPALEAYMDQLRRDGDSCGARVEVEASGVPVGWGAPLYDRLDADITHAMMAINAVKGVEIGAGFGAVTQRGSQHGDELTPEGFVGNEAGGILGGISTGQDIRVSLAIKPTSSIRIERRSIDREGKPVMMQTLGRHDPCVGIRATPIVEAVLALVLIDHCLLHRAQCGDVDSGLAPIPASAPPTQ